MKAGMVVAFICAGLTAGLGMAFGQSDKPIKIGVLIDASSFSADLGGVGSVKAAQMAVEDQGGRAAGRPVQILSADMQAKPDIATSIARKWFETEGVDAIADLPTSSTTLAVQAIAREKKKILLIAGATTTELTGSQCSPYSVQWADDTNALAVGAPKTLAAAGFKTWFFVAADFAFGTAMSKSAQAVVQANGGKVLGEIRHPTDTADMSSYLLAAQNSHAQIIGLANVGTDLIASIKQAAEFGLAAGGQKLLGFMTFVTDVHALGLEESQGLYVTTSFYWDANEKTRAFAKRFFALHGKMPTKEQAHVYLAIRHYLNAVDAVGSADSDTVIAKMKTTPTDEFGVPGSIRQDGRVLYDLEVYQVKTPADSKYAWDYYKPYQKITAAEAFKPMDEKACAFLAGK